MRTYLHMLFHCIYMHPFLIQTPKVMNLHDILDVAADICVEAAVNRLDPPPIDGDDKRNQYISTMDVKLFIPELIVKEILKKNYDLEDLAKTFKMDDHIWRKSSQGNGNGNNGQDSHDNNSDQDGGGNSQDKDEQNDKDNQDGNGNNNQNKVQKGSQSGGGSNNSQSNPQQEKLKKDWQDVSKRIAVDMQSFNKNQGNGTGDLIQEIDFLTQDNMDYDTFLRQFSILEEKMMINQDEFDYIYYMYGLSMSGKKKLLIEPLEYKEEKTIKDFVIALDTSRSCSGELVKKFLNKTYSILKSSENFSSKVNIHIIQCDAAVKSDTKITTLNELEHYIQHMQLRGFGGTDFRPVFNYVDQLEKKQEFTNLCGLLYFTDGYGTYPKKPTKYKTAFVFLEDYNRREVPSWALSVYWKE